MGFSFCYPADMLVAIDMLDRSGSIEHFLRAFDATDHPSEAQIITIAILTCAATYDRDPDAFLGIRLPFDDSTGEPIAERWNTWLARDPVRLAEAHADSLRGLKGLFIDCGDKDEHRLHFGARRLHDLLEAAGVSHRFELFPGGHDRIEHRLDASLPFLAHCLSDHALGPFDSKSPG